MIGLYSYWSGDALAPPLADRFAGSLGIGVSQNIGVRTSGGATMVSALGNSRTARGWSPARSPRGDYVLFIGHIDNRDALMPALGSGVNPSCDDASFYGHCYAQWGDECDLKIIGQYAAIIRSPERKSIRVVRSPIYAPPLHIWTDNDRVIIASASRAIFATGEVHQELDKQKIADSLFLNYADAERGWFKGVMRLPLGTRALIDQNGMDSVSYYDPFAAAPVRYSRDEDYVEAANTLFEEATRAALKGFSKPAVSVSGGYDSQAVAANALKVMPQGSRLLGLTSVPEPGWDGRSRPKRFGDERDYVKALAAMYPRMDVEFVDAAGLSFDHKLEAMFLLAGSAPRNAMNLHWIHEVHARAKAAGCDVVLTGSMGNATFSFNGSGAYPGWFRCGAWPRLSRELWAVRGQHKTLAHAVGSRLVLPFLSSGLNAALSKWRSGKPADIFETWCPLNREWAKDMNVAQRAEDMGFDPNFRPRLSTQSYRVAMSGGASNEAGDIRQAMSTISGIPTRDPTSYRPLLEFCYNIPDDQYLRGGQARWLSKRMLKGIVPEKVLAETRRGQQAADWHLRLGRQREQLIDEIDRLSEDTSMAAMLDLPRLRKALDDWPDRTPTKSDDPNRSIGMALSRALTTARFIRYVEGGNG